MLAALSLFMKAQFGYTGWRFKLLEAFASILRRLSAVSDGQNQLISDTIYQLTHDTLRGISALAQSEPLKFRIVDQCLPYLMKAKAFTGRSDRSEILTTAGQVCHNLGFGEATEGGLEISSITLKGLTNLHQ